MFSYKLKSRYTAAPLLPSISVVVWNIPLSHQIDQFLRPSFVMVIATHVSTPMMGILKLHKFHHICISSSSSQINGYIVHRDLEPPMNQGKLCSTQNLTTESNLPWSTRTSELCLELVTELFFRILFTHDQTLQHRLTLGPFVFPAIADIGTTF